MQRPGLKVSCFEKVPTKLADNLKRVVLLVSRGKVMHRLVVTKFWINGRASEDRHEWTEEVEAHCEKCYDDKGDVRVPGRKHSSPKQSWRMFNCSPRPTNPDHILQGLPCTTENVEQGQRVRRQPGDGDAPSVCRRIPCSRWRVGLTNCSKENVEPQRRRRSSALVFPRGQTPSLRRDFAASAQLPY